MKSIKNMNMIMNIDISNCLEIKFGTKIIDSLFLLCKTKAMKTRISGFIFLLTILLSTDTLAIETSPKITDREIIEKLTRLEEGQNTIRAEIKGIQQQIADLKEGQKALEGRMDSLIYAVLGGFITLFAIITAFIGVVIWDRRTALSPALKKNKELEERLESLEKIQKQTVEREEKVEEALKGYAFKESKFAEILRSVGIM